MNHAYRRESQIIHGGYAGGGWTWTANLCHQLLEEAGPCSGDGRVQVKKDRYMQMVLQTSPSLSINFC
jgi:hypothetical protein